MLFCIKRSVSLGKTASIFMLRFSDKIRVSLRWPNISLTYVFFAKSNKKIISLHRYFRFALHKSDWLHVNFVNLTTVVLNIFQAWHILVFNSQRIRNAVKTNVLYTVRLFVCQATPKLTWNMIWWNIAARVHGFIW